jgi:hypothetical protein
VLSSEGGRQFETLHFSSAPFKTNSPPAQGKKYLEKEFHILATEGVLKK